MALMRLVPIGAVAALIAILFARPAGAGDADAAGWRVHRDPSSGRPVTPSAATAAAMARSDLRDETAPVVEETTANGVVYVDLGGRFRTTLRAERRSGGVAAQCTQAAGTSSP